MHLFLAVAAVSGRRIGRSKRTSKYCPSPPDHCSNGGILYPQNGSLLCGYADCLLCIVFAKFKPKNQYDFTASATTSRSVNGRPKFQWRESVLLWNTNVNVHGRVSLFITRKVGNRDRNSTGAMPIATLSNLLCQVVAINGVRKVQRSSRI